MIDLGRLGTAGRYIDFALMIGNTREAWAGQEDAQVASTASSISMQLKTQIGSG
jgi:aminoglycoside phosphotransferase